MIELFLASMGGVVLGFVIGYIQSQKTIGRTLRRLRNETERLQVEAESIQAAIDAMPDDEGVHMITTGPARGY